MIPNPVFKLDIYNMIISCGSSDIFISRICNIHDKRHTLLDIWPKFLDISIINSFTGVLKEENVSSSWYNYIICPLFLFTYFKQLV